jgi:hypothetical protein
VRRAKNSTNPEVNLHNKLANIFGKVALGLLGERSTYFSVIPVLAQRRMFGVQALYAKARDSMGYQRNSVWQCWIQASSRESVFQKKLFEIDGYRAICARLE